MDFGFRLLSSIKRCLCGIECSDMMVFPKQPNARGEFSTLRVHALEARDIDSGFRVHILRILRRSHEPQVCNSVVGSVSVDVIYEKFRKLSVHKIPRQSMCLHALAINFDNPVAIAFMASDVAGLRRPPINFSCENSAVRAVMQDVFGVFDRLSLLVFGIKSAHREISHIERSMFGCGQGRSEVAPSFRPAFLNRITGCSQYIPATQGRAV